MGHPKRRVNPQITSHVNRDFKRLFITQLWKVLKKENNPWVKDPRGNPHSPKMVVFSIIIKVAFLLTYDGTEAELKSMKEFITQITNYNRIVTHSVIWDGTKLVSMKYLRRVFKRTIQKVEKKRRVAVDSSGFSSKNSSVWYDIRIQRQNKKKDCLKLHILVDVDNGQILSVRISKSSAHDSPKGRRMVTEWTDLDIVSGDTAYANRPMCNASSGKCYFLPRKDAVSRSRGSPKYKIMVRCYKDNEEAWLDIYHIRSFVEAVFASIKKRFGKILLSIKKRMQHKELFLKTISYNIKESLYNLRAHQLNISRWIECD